MENKSHAFMVGVFTLVLLTAAILVGIWLNRDHIETVPYQIATKLSVPGLNPQAAVRYRGLDVGRVEGIIFDPQVPGQILININVRPDTPVTHSTYATLGYQGVTGIAYVQLDDDGSQPVKLPSSENQVARIALRPSLFDTLQNKGLAILEQTEEVAKRVNNLLSNENQETVLAAFNNVSKAASELQSIPRQLQPTLSKLPALTTQAQQSLNSIGKLSSNLDALTTELKQPNGTIDRLADAIDRVGLAADSIQLEALPLSNDVRTSLRQLNRTLEGISERPQSVLFGSRRPEPGPGEADFSPPAE
ncbi:MlaD family protein [Oxalobacteraceae bacterium R-40]|uniref:MlaD family protein n=1 Tax=Keguizhuia sedimenti TaxID=3064264 RepID=A0ABU1BJY3_9BURK|nr:MlaD family protein [Oxalobacteraceae bacterium R-40]